MNRRELITGLGLVALGSAGTAAAQQTQQRDALVVIFLRGGADGLSMVPPYTEAEYFAQRPHLAVPQPGDAGGALDLDGRFGLHPALSPLKPFYDAGDLAFVHATGLAHDSRSHFDAQNQMERGSLANTANASGWLGRHLAASGDSGSPLRAASMQHNIPKSLSGESATAALPQLDLYQIFGSFPIPYLDKLRSLQSGVEPKLTEDTASAFSLIDTVNGQRPWEQPLENGAVYPATTAGASLSRAAKLLKAQTGTEIVHIDLRGWDTHGDQVTRLPNLFSDLGSSLAAFHTDMGSRMANITVVVMTEFGRRVAQNASAGTDHGKGGCMMLLGGGVNGGQIHADWPGLAAANLDDGDLAITTDYRQVLGEMLVKRRGASNLSSVFPDLGTAPTDGLFLSN